MLRLLSDAAPQPSSPATQSGHVAAVRWLCRQLHSTASAQSPIHVEDEPYGRSAFSGACCSPALHASMFPAFDSTLHTPPLWSPLFLSQPWQASEQVPLRRQRQQIVLGNRVPTTAPDTWMAPDAVIIGDVDLFDRVRTTVDPFVCEISQGRQNCY